MEYRIPKKGDIYRHFKGNLYEIIIIARDSETLEEKVVYKSVEGEEAYVRPLSMFLSRVDKVKYPDAAQEQRFEFIRSTEDIQTKTSVTEEGIEEKTVLEDGSLVMDFLDLESANDKIQFLLHNKESVTENFLSIVAQSLDFVENAGSICERFDDILKYLRTVSKYENTRFR